MDYICAGYPKKCYLNKALSELVQEEDFHQKIKQAFKLISFVYICSLKLVLGIKVLTIKLTVYQQRVFK
jgi:hypothetical protein